MTRSRGFSIVQRQKVRVANGRSVFCAPKVGPSHLVIAEAGEGVWAFSRASLSLEWHRPFLWPALLGALERGAVVEHEDGCEGLDWNGRTLWSRAPGRCLSAGTEIVENLDGVLSLVEMETGDARVLADAPQSRPAILAGSALLVVGLEDRTVSAFDLASGAVLWAQDYVEVVRQSHGLHDSNGVFGLAPGSEGRFLLSRLGHLFCASIKDGVILWSAPVAVPYRAPCAQAGRVFVWSCALSAKVTTVDLATGAITREVPPKTANRLVILDEATGAILVDRDLADHGPGFAETHQPQSPAVGRKHIVFTTDTGLVAVFRLSDGELVWSHSLRSKPYEPAVDGNEIYVPCADGTLRVFECQDGEL